MRQTEFSLRECYTLACYGLRAVINAGRLEGFTKEDEDGIQVQENYHEAVRMVPEGV